MTQPALNGLSGAVRMPERHAHCARPVLERDHLGAALDGAAERGQAVRQDLLGPPLGQAALELPRAACAGEVRLGDRPQRCVQDPSESQRHRGQQLLPQDARLRENLQRSRLESRRPRLARRLRLALNYPGLHPVSRQLRGGEQAGRTRAHDKHGNAGDVADPHQHPPAHHLSGARASDCPGAPRGSGC